MLFRLTEVTKSYGAQEVLRGVTFQLNPGEHVGLVGRNGAGKTTIFRIITGAESPDKGEFDSMRGLRVGVLAQHVDFSGAETVMDAALAVFEKLRSLETKMRDLEHAMTEVSGEELDRVMHDYSEAQHTYEHEGGFSYHARAESVLLGLGFGKEEFDKKAENLSGGEKNRLGLARLLLLEPDILLLDEPTNHLDVDAVEWLEEFLSAYKSAYLIISHDRFFLDHTVKRVLDLEFGKVDSYKGNYSEYVVEKEERREQQQRAYEQQREMIERTEDFIRRNLAGQKTKQAKSRRNMLQRMDRLESVNNLDTASFKLKPTARTGDQVLILDKLAIGFKTTILADKLELTLRRGERLGIIGGNGTGKTTLLRTLLGEQRPLGGDMRWGTGVKTGYYDQRLLTVDDRNSVLDELRTIASATITDGELRGFLGRFLFSGDDVFKPVAALSGGEKGRLALAKLIYSRVNVLVLDEPTNHLDIASCEALEDALNEFDGTIITVSHDRYFLDRIATQILAFTDKGTEYFDGGYTEFYEEHHRTLAEQQAREAEAQKAERAARKVETPKPASGKKNKQKGPTAFELETSIQTAEAELQELAAQLSTEEVARDKDKLFELSEKYETLETRIAELYQTWEALLETESEAMAAKRN
ncbi:MAG TPA: ABC-F family ATP-binding cassette domain-containing protein [Blastocatellia bacterium]|nr:ABC-F family ATP-binding cassette domain-containing protein [Blastocatellia bacterium]HMV85519.1 ABC-F family ATP-binding cassette domain-containing protein [Blastocatellia bacterium]HMY73776.1 ABC-F family ATP-binding cassette domain-containing protein [Blastocatellia bacterium]HNG32403.1 ABC-F family ATP-binding cassette domain-containing protein [Blastocatellia bacterium]